MKQYLILPLALLIYFSCKKSNEANPCISYDTTINRTSLIISEVLYDTSFSAPDTVLENELVNFQFDHPYHANILSANWSINDNDYTSSSRSFDLRFTEKGVYRIRLVVTYIPEEECDVRSQFSDTIIKSIQVLSLNHTSKLEGNYFGFLDDKVNETFTVNINYWKYSGDDAGGYYLRNYVEGCTGDGLNPNVPTGTGFEIINGYSSFNIVSYPCSAPGNFKGFGFLNNTGDSIIIKHFGYAKAIPDVDDTIPVWHVFKGKKL